MAPPISLLEQRKIEARVLIPMIRAFESEFGREATHRIVAECVAGIAKEQAGEFAEQCGEDDPVDLARYLVPSFTKDDALEIDVVADSADEYSFDVTRCRFAEFYKEMGAEDLGKLLSCSRDFAAAEGLSAELQLERKQTLMEGKSCCDFRFQRCSSNKTPSKDTEEE